MSFSTLGQKNKKCLLYLHGFVLDAHDKTPLAYAIIYIKEKKRMGVTDSLGYYQIDGLCKENYTIVCKHIKCNTIQKSITLDSSLRLDFSPEHHAQLLQSIYIHDNSQTTEEDNFFSHIYVDLERIEMERQRGNTLGESLNVLPGVSALQTGSNIWKPIIHGLHSNRIAIINNEIKQEDQQWGMEHAPNIDPFIAKKITLITGAATVLYGSDASGGVILVESESLANTTRFNGDIYLIGNTNGRQGTISTDIRGILPPVDSLIWRFQTSLTRGGDRYTSTYQLTNTGITETNISTELFFQRRTYKLHGFYSRFSTNLGILKGSHVGNLTDLEKAIEQEKPLVINDFSYRIENPKQQIVHHLIKVKGHYQLKEGTKLTFKYGWQKNHRLEFDIRRGGRINLPSVDLSLNTHSAQLLFTSYLSKLWKYNLGVSSFYQENKTDPRTLTRRLIPDYTSYGNAVFFIGQHKKSHWSGEIGVRYSHHFLESFKWFNRNDWEDRYINIFSRYFIKSNGNNTQVLANPRFEFHNFTFILAGSLNLNKYWTLKSNLATALRPPNVGELFSDGLHHGVAAIEYGNLLLKAEKSFKWTGSLNFEKSSISVSLNLYYHHFDNYINLELTGVELSIRGAFPVYTYNQVTARCWGTDASFHLKFGPKWNYSSRFSFTSIKDLNKDAYVLFVPPPQWNNSLTFQIPKWSFFQGIQASLVTETSFKPVQAPTTISIRNLIRINSLEDRKNIFDLIPPPDTYCLMGIKIDFLLALKDKQSIDLGFYVDNLLNIRYRNYLNRFKYYADELGINIKLKFAYHF